MAYNLTVDVLTLEDIVPQVVDTVLRSNVFATKMLSKTKKFRAATQDFPIKYQVGTAVQSFIGFDQLPTSFTDTRILMKYNPRFNAANVALAGTDISANNVVQKVLDLTEIEMISRAQDLADAIGNQLYSSGLGNNSKDFLGLGAIVDNGNTVSTIGGLSTLRPILRSSPQSLSPLPFPHAFRHTRTLFNAIALMASSVPNRIYTD